MKRQFALILVICVAAFFASRAFAQTITVKSKSNSARQCAICHYEMIDLFVNTGAGTEIALYPETKTAASERMCFSCHDGSVADSRLKVWNGSKLSHKTGVSLKDNMSVSPLLPLESGKITCATCHTPHGTSGSEGSFEDIASSLFLRLPLDDSQLCKACHTDMNGSDSHALKAPNKSFITKILEKGGFVSKEGNVTCVSCHSVHGSAEQKLVIANPLDMTLCKTCHENLFTDILTKKPVKTPHISYSSPLEKRVIDTVTQSNGKLDAKNGLICYSCHSVHKAKGKNILNFTGKDEEFCVKCHDNMSNMAQSSHNLTLSDNIYRTVDGQSSAEAGLCGTCHGGHKWNLSTALLTKEDNITGLCMNCHNPKGAAAKKAIDLDMYNHFTGSAYSVLKDSKPKNSTELVEKTLLFMKNLTLDKNKVLALSVGENVSCITCHDIHGKDKMFVRAETSSGKLCVSCHKNQNDSLKTPHGTDKLNTTCLGCHKIHNSPVKTLVIEGAKNDGCLSCHDAKVNLPKNLPKSMKDKMPDELIFKGHNHPTGIDNATVFPLPAYSKKDGTFSCVSCHDPHVSDNKSAMKGSFVRTAKNIKSSDDFCVLCHDKEKVVLQSSHATDPKKPFIANPRTKRAGGTCDTCHITHNALAEKGIPVVKAVYATPEDLCLNCHKENGNAKDKKIDKNKGHASGLLDKTKIPDKVKRDFLTQEKGRIFLYCNNCHDPHQNGPEFGAEGNITNSFLKNLDEKGKNTVICVSCHDTKEVVKLGGHGVSNFDKKNKDEQTKLKIKNKDICGACHEMHNSDREFLMPGATGKDRCMRCHDIGKMSDKLVETYHRIDVDVEDKTKFALENDKITCKTCHNTHADSKFLVQTEWSKSEDLCVACHDKQKPVIISMHNMSISDTKDKKLAANSIGSACEPCHSSHKLKSETGIVLGAKSVDGHLIEESCVKCHAKGKSALKIPDYLRHSSIFKLLKMPEQFKDFTYGSDGRTAVNGLIDCATCHNPHVWSVDPLKLTEYYKFGLKIDGDNSTGFLKGDVKDTFCVTCHEKPNEWYDDFHSKKYREERLDKKAPKLLLERLFNISR